MEGEEDHPLDKKKGKEIHQETQLPNRDSIQSEVCSWNPLQLKHRNSFQVISLPAVSQLLLRFFWKVDARLH
jgi:hypothetical protein